MPLELIISCFKSVHINETHHAKTRFMTKSASRVHNLISYIVTGYHNPIIAIHDTTKCARLKLNPMLFKPLYSLNSAEYDLYSASKCLNANNCHFNIY